MWRNVEDLNSQPSIKKPVARLVFATGKPLPEAFESLSSHLFPPLLSGGNVNIYRSEPTTISQLLVAD